MFGKNVPRGSVDVFYLEPTFSICPESKYNAESMPDDILVVDDGAYSSILSPAVITAVDQTPAEAFNIGDNGFVLNDLVALSRASSEAAAKVMIERLTENPDTPSPYEGLPLDRRIAMIRPRSCQTPVELEQYAERIGNLDYEAIQQKVAKKQALAAKRAAEGISAGTSSQTSSVAYSETQTS